MFFLEDIKEDSISDSLLLIEDMLYQFQSLQEEEEQKNSPQQNNNSSSNNNSKPSGNSNKKIDIKKIVATFLNFIKGIGARLKATLNKMAIQMKASITKIKVGSKDISLKGDITYNGKSLLTDPSLIVNMVAPIYQEFNRVYMKFTEMNYDELKKMKEFKGTIDGIRAQSKADDEKVFTVKGSLLVDVTTKLLKASETIDSRQPGIERGVNRVLNDLLNKASSNNDTNNSYKKYQYLQTLFNLEMHSISGIIHMIQGIFNKLNSGIDGGKEANKDKNNNDDQQNNKDDKKSGEDDKVKNENSLGGIAAYAPAEPVHEKYPTPFPNSLDDYMNNDKYDNPSNEWMEHFVESYFYENKYNSLSESALERELLNEEVVSGYDILDNFFNEEDNDTNSTIDSEYKNMKRSKDEKSQRHEEIKNKLKSADKAKIAEAISMAKGDMKEKMKQPGFFTKTRKILRMITHLGIQVGWWLVPLGPVTKLVGSLAIYSAHRAKENKITQEEQRYFKDEIAYYKDLEEKTDDPVRKRNIVKVRREFERANATIADDIRMKEQYKKQSGEGED